MSSGPALTLAALNDVEVRVTVTLGDARCRVSDVLAFTEGTIVPLGASARAPVELLVNGIVVAVGDLVEIENGMLAVEITAVRAATAAVRDDV
ncbi:MAG: FliM/FliN family flagellar motor switch protein [Candidatus Eremiobacteraeota bacterium]|nr:FliM/FliN family flagellar motor switch protein [Candidatus Eremiobacteraeota bacterium]MBV8222357.1 FliM/FliN family flagellar motor switch protein [Candidatus Eremiobacteraeota bacterium]MBV8281483.1 FliM/FliN family flagellar motor switch protein [Candidatus Eremiobacteraeota bacterium]